MKFVIVCLLFLFASLLSSEIEAYKGRRKGYLEPLNENKTYNCDSNNPCTVENADAQKFYFPYKDKNKFILCDNFQTCVIMDCPNGYVWDKEAHSCNYVF